jgi:SAM-dependent methyltransferase
VFSEVIVLLNEYIASGSVLEIGCSKGFMCHELNENGYFSVGGDISLTALSEAKNIEAICLDGEILSFKDDCFDAVLAINTICHMPKPAESIKEIYRVLKKGGVFIAITPDRDSPMGKIGRYLVKYTSLKNPYHVGLMNKEELASYLKEAGFKQFTVLPFHNGFFMAPIIRNFKRPFIPIPMKIHIPFSPHLIAIAHASE